MTMAYIRRYYGVPAKRGGRVSWAGREGTITRATAYVYVRFDGDSRSRPLHPREGGLGYIDPPDGAASEGVTDGD